MLGIAIGSFGLLFGIWMLIQSIDQGVTPETGLIAVWLIFGLSLVSYEVFRTHTRKLWAVLHENGVSDADGQFYSWDELDEIRYMFGALWIGTSDDLLPKVSIDPQDVGEEDLERAEQYLRANAPERLLRKL